MSSNFHPLLHSNVVRQIATTQLSAVSPSTRLSGFRHTRSHLQPVLHILLRQHPSPRWYCRSAKFDGQRCSAAKHLCHRSSLFHGDRCSPDEHHRRTVVCEPAADVQFWPTLGLRQWRSSSYNPLTLRLLRQVSGRSLSITK